MKHFNFFLFGYTSCVSVMFNRFCHRNKALLVITSCFFTQNKPFTSFFSISFNKYCFFTILKSKIYLYISSISFEFSSLRNRRCFSTVWSNLLYLILRNYGSLLGFKESLEIVGYSRRAWYNQGVSKFMYIKSGRSHINKILVGSLLTTRLLKRRLVFLFSCDWARLYHCAHKIYEARPVDSYKGVGVKYTTRKLMLKSGKSLSK